ncbi:MAG: DUF4393 domain-containing protein [Lachnospiraceae bacterium]
MDKELLEKATEIIPTIYDDGVKPATVESGKVLSLIPKTINAALSPLRIWIAQKEYNVAETEQLLAEKLSKVSEDKIVTPESYVAVPALQAISYSMSSDELREMYANLLAKAMYADTKEKVHPSLVEIIKQLSPLDAFVFKSIMGCEVVPIVDFVYKNKEEAYRIISKNITAIIPDKVKLVGVSINNLQKQGLIFIPEDGYYTNDSVYSPIINGEFYNTMKASHPTSNDGFAFDIKKKTVEKTNLGSLFYEVCIQNI